MRAIVHTRYGPPDVLQLKDVQKPTPRDNEILIKIFATTVNRTDCGFRKAEPFLVRFFSGLFRPKRTVLGNELAGEVEAVGKRVTLFRPGDHVFGLTGDTFGAHAEYVCLPEDGSVATKPATMSFADAAALCDGAMLALTFLSKLNIHAGQTILINGASGSIGTAAVQLAKHFGAEVTAVCGTRNVEMVASLGADAVIDYTTEDFTKQGRAYDVVVDAVGKSTFARCKGIIKQGGAFVPSELGFLMQNPIYAMWTTKFGDKKVMFPIPKHSKQDILLFRDLFEAGKLRAVVDRCFPLEDIVEAYRYVEAGHKTGNVVITVDHENAPASSR